MKSKQINFYVLPDELAAFNQFLKANHWLIIGVESKNGLPEVAESIVKTNDSDLIKVCLVKESMVNEVRFKFIEKQQIYSIDTFNNAPLIEVTRPFYNHEESFLRRGRLYYQLGYYNELNELVLKSDEFITEAAKLFKAFKKAFKNVKYAKFKGVVITSQTINCIENSELILK